MSEVVQEDRRNVTVTAGEYGLGFVSGKIGDMIEALQGAVAAGVVDGKSIDDIRYRLALNTETDSLKIVVEYDRPETADEAESREVAEIEGRKSADAIGRERALELISHAVERWPDILDDRKADCPICYGP